MLDLPGHPLLDKTSLIGECTRLNLQVDAARLRDEVDDLPADLWGGSAGRVGVHRNAEAMFLRGFAPAEGEKPIEERPPFARLPYLRTIIDQIGAPPLRCLLARLPPATSIPLHRDLPPYFGKSIRIHIPVKTNEFVFMLSGGSAYRMQCGEVWALNNSASHGVINAHPSEARMHVICDFLPNAVLLGLLREAARDLGFPQAGLAKMSPSDGPVQGNPS